MSIPSLFRTHNEGDHDTTSPNQQPQVSPLGRIARLTFLTSRFTRGRRTGASYLNTGHLNEHVRRDIGLEHSDITAPD